MEEPANTPQTQPRDTPSQSRTRDLVTDTLLAWRAGDGGAVDRLFPLVYDELHRIAHRQLRHERPGHTLNTTAVVHEAYLDLVDQQRAEWVDRAHFLGAAAFVMRRVLLEHARSHNAAKRGGGLSQVTLDDALIASADERAEMLLVIDDALTRLAEVDKRLARVVECRFFGGLTAGETAEVLGITERTVERDWVKAKMLLAHSLKN
jgi:RNA polymerase sigma factor (TIGR02999 family)